MKFKDSIQLVKSIRQLAIDTMSEILSASLNKSEFSLASEIHFNLSKNSTIAPSGWYDPPLNGIAVLTAKNGDFSRLRFDTLDLFRN